MTNSDALHILQAYAPGVGGIERVVEALAIGHRRRGHRVSLAALVFDGQENSPALGRMRSAGVEIHPIATGARAYRRERHDFIDVCRAARPNIVHTHGLRVDIVEGGAARALRLPVVTTLHGRTGGSLKWRLFEWLQYGFVRRFSAIVAVSQPQADYLRRRGIPAGRIHVIQNAWAPATPSLSRDDARRVLGVADHVALIGWVGRLSREKGPDVFVDALAALETPAVRAAVLGDGREAESLRAQARQRSIDERIHWLGSVPDAGRLFKAFDVFVLSSRTEGTPIALFEAMAAEVPIVATRVGGVPGVVSDAEASLVPTEDPRELSRAIAEVLRSPAVARERAGRAHQRLRSAFDPQPWLAAYERLYRDVAGGALTTPPNR